MDADMLPDSAKIAVVGIGCRYAGGINDVEDFVQMLQRGTDCTSEPPDGRYDMKHFYRPDKSPGKMYNARGGYINTDLEAFDREFFKMSPEEACYLDPQVRLLLEVSYESFENAGIPLEKVKGTRTGCYMGVTANEYLMLNAVPQDNIGQYTNSGTNSCMVANRLSYEFDLRGPSFSVDTACSSSLYAIQLACQAIRHGECDMAIAGGVNLLLTPVTSIGFCQAGMLAPDGRCKSFDNSADGYSRSEGAGVIVLKPLLQAISDGDNIYTVIRGGALSNDGRTPGIANPSYNAQVDLVYRACRSAKINPHSVEYIEAHGTGTKVGDKTEANALGEALGESRTPGDPKLFLGSVKSNFGHTEGAAGVAGIIKVALMQYHNFIPPVVNFRIPNQNIAFSDLKLIVPTDVCDWPQPPKERHRLAGCSSFGFGGANAHLILEEPPRRATQQDPVSHQLTMLCFSGSSKDALVERKFTIIEQFQAERPTQEDFMNIVASSFFRSTHHRYRSVVVGYSSSDVIQKLNNSKSDATIEGVATQKDNLSKIVFVFTGMGSQWWAMGRSLYQENKTFRETILRFDDELSSLGASWTMTWLLTETKDSEFINKTNYAQPAICAVEMGIVEMLKTFGVTADAIVGHSVGEVAAAYASGMLNFERAVRVIYYRGLTLSTTSGRGKMLAVLHHLNDVRAELHESGLRSSIDIAAVNSPTQIVLSGDSQSIQKFEKILKAKDIKSVVLKVDNAFHSFQQEVVKDILKSHLSFLNETCKEPASSVPMISTVSGKYVDAKEINTNEYWWKNVRQKVCFQQAITSLLDDGYTTFIEIGAHPALRPAIKDVVTSKSNSSDKTLILPTLKRPKDTQSTSNDKMSIYQTLATLHCGGYTVDFSRLYPKSFLVKPLPLNPWQRVICSSVTPASRGTMLHPHNEHYLLGKKEPKGPGLPDTIHEWNSELTVQTVPWVKDHIIQSSIIAPGTSYLEIAMQATKELQSSNFPVTITDIDLKKFLFMPDCQATLRVIVQEGEKMSLSIHSKGSGDTWTTHATCTVCPDQRATEIPRLDINDIKAKCRTYSGAEADVVYDNFTEMGFSLGPSFQSGSEAWFNDDASEACMVIKAAEAIKHELDVYNFHPALLDAVYQSVAVCMIIKQKKEAAVRGIKHKPVLYVPLGIQKLELFRPVSDELYVAIKTRELDQMYGDVYAADASGKIVIAITGVMFGAASDNDEANEVRLWKLDLERIQLSTENKKAENILAIHTNETNSDLLQKYVSNGTRIQTKSIKQIEQERYTTFKDRHNLRHLLFFADDVDPTLANMTCLKQGFCNSINKSLVVLNNIAKELQSSSSPPPILWILTRGAIRTNNSCSPFAYTIQSFGISLMQEAIDIKVYMVDLPTKDDHFVKCLPMLRTLLANPPADENELVIDYDGQGPVVQSRRLNHFAPEAITHKVSSTDNWSVKEDAKSQLIKLVPLMKRESPKNNELTLQVKAFKLFENHSKGEFVAIVAGQAIMKTNGFKTGDRLIGLTTSSVRSMTDLPHKFCCKIPSKIGYDAAVVCVYRFLTPYIVASSLNLKKKSILFLGKTDEQFFSDITSAFGGLKAGNRSEVDIIINLDGSVIPQSQLNRLKSHGKIVHVNHKNEQPLQPNSLSQGLISSMTISRHLHPHDPISNDLGNCISDMLRKCHAANCIPLSNNYRLASISDEFSADSHDVVCVDRVRDGVNVKLQVEGNLIEANPQASYVVVGAAKGFGIEILKWLAKSGAKNIIAVYRTAMPQGGDLQTTRELENRGVHIQWYKGDITDMETVRKIYKSARLPIEGVFHVAAVYMDKWLSRLEEKDWHSVMMPKAYGAYLLHKISIEMGLPLKHFVMFSSIVSILGSTGQANYCAANSYLYGLGQYRRSQGLPATVASMGVINTIGFAARNDLIKSWEDKGVGSLTPEKALEIVAMMINLDIFHLGFTGFFNAKDYFLQHQPQVNEHLRNPEGTFSRWKIILTKELLQKRSKGIAQNLMDKAPAEAKETIYQLMATCLAEKLGIADPESITKDNTLIAYGLDSLMAPDMSLFISETFHVSLQPVALLNDKNTIGKLVSIIYDKIMENSSDNAGRPSNTDEKPQLVEVNTLENTNKVLICFPPNGGGPSTFHGWQKAMTESNIQMYVVQMPGWEGSEAKPLTTLEEIVSLVCEELSPVLEDKTFVIYGHSFGALIGYEVAQLLRARYDLLPCDIFCAAWYSPVDPYVDPQDISPRMFSSNTPIAEAIEMARSFKFLDEDVLQNENVMRRMLPCIEVSLAMCKSYEHRHREQLTCNMHVFAGNGDRFIPAKGFQRWSKIAPADKFTFKELKGKHLFLLNADCARVICDDIAVCFRESAEDEDMFTRL